MTIPLWLFSFLIALSLYGVLALISILQTIKMLGKGNILL